MDFETVFLSLVGAIAVFYMVVSIIEAYFTLKERYVDRMMRKISRDRGK